ncbi:hypothetical protein [Aliiroseovarius subalbicans]|uniref:hypothetical protein n=1 Tax=Aliiroseovarius subalbicans TaxID=2925840 RepID=UPI001F5A64E9|nr:hypothetical protein [Aliiroseovarius subalbicans]MCI2399281.1 hypothetical protein [Aliiroseovarius subalbicans]
MSKNDSLGGYVEALEYARESARELLNLAPLEDWRQMTVPYFILDFHPEIRKEGATPEETTYVVSDRLAMNIAASANRDPDFFEIAALVCAANVFNGKSVPKPLRPFALKSIRMLHEPPRLRGPKPGREFVVKMLLRKAAMDLEMMFDIEVARGDDKPGGSACDVVVEVSKEVGFFCEYNTVRDWCQNPKNAVFRQKADSLVAMMKDSYLIKIRALNPRS